MTWQPPVRLRLRQASCLVGWSGGLNANSRSEAKEGIKSVSLIAWTVSATRVNVQLLGCHRCKLQDAIKACKTCMYGRRTAGLGPSGFVWSG